MIMKVIDQLVEFEENIDISKSRSDGAAATRILTVYRDVVLYLMADGKIEADQSANVIWKYIKNFTPAALYKVANVYRVKNQLPPLNYTQSIYHMKQMKI